MKLLFSLLASLISIISWSQTVVVTDDNTYLTGHASSVLDVKSDSKGMLVPRLTSAQRSAISSPATGLLVYQTDGTSGFYYYNGSAWTGIAYGIATQWLITGNTGNTAANFIGTTDNVSLRLRTNNTERMIVDSTGQVGIGVSVPTALLHIRGNNPIKLFGVQAGASTDSLLTITNGVVKKLPIGNGTAGLWSLTGNTSTTAANFIGTTDNVSLRLRTNNTQRMIVDSTGQVGIGVSAPTASLHIVGTTPLKLFGLPAGDNTDSVLTIDGGTVQKISISTGTNGLWSLKGNGSTDTTVNYIGTSDAKSLHIKTNATDRIVVNSAGNVGIGTASPAATLDVAGTVKLGTSGTEFTNIVVGTATLSASSITTSAQKTATATITGAQLNGIVHISPRASLGTAVIIAYAYVSAANTVTVVFGCTNGTRSFSNKVFDIAVLNP